MKRLLRVVVADDHPLMRDAIAARLDAETDIEVVARAESAASLLALIAEHQPDVALVDLTMRDGTTLDVFDRLRAASPATAFVLFSASEDPGDVTAALSAGMRGFLSKSIESASIAPYLREVAAGATVLDTASATVMASAMRQQLAEPLSPREIDILRLVAAGKTNRAIAQQLYVSISTVKTHLERAFGKLNVADRSAAVARAKDLKLL